MSNLTVDAGLYELSSFVPRSGLDPDWCAKKTKGLTNLIFEKPLECEMQLYGAVCEQNERWGGDRSLSHVENLHALTHGNGGAIEIDALEESVHLGGRNPLSTLGCDFFQQREDFLRAIAGLRRDEHDRHVAQEFQFVAQTSFVCLAVTRATGFAHTLRLCGAAGLLVAGNHQVPLVDDDDNRTAGLVRIASDGSIQLAHPFGGINDEQRDVGRFQMLPRHYD